MSAETFRQSIEIPSDRVIVALDKMTWEQADTVMREVGPYVGMAKANSIAQKKGWEHAVETIDRFGVFAMADAKYHDTDETMRDHLIQVTECTPQLVTVHASNGLSALRAAVEGRNEAIVNLDLAFGLPGTRANRLGRDNVARILGVTVLTSIESKDDPDVFDECQSIYGAKAKEKVLQFAHTAAEAGLDGIVCSGEELEMVRSDSSLDKLLTVVPGINPLWNVKPGGQKRIVTPTQALQSGADCLVLGRPITQPSHGISRAEAAQRIAQELAEA